MWRREKRGGGGGDRSGNGLESADKRLNNGQANCSGGTTERDKRTDDANSTLGFGADARQLDGKRAVSAGGSLAVLRSSRSHDTSVRPEFLLAGVSRAPLRTLISTGRFFAHVLIFVGADLPRRTGGAGEEGRGKWTVRARS